MHFHTNRTFLTFPRKSLDMAKQRLQGKIVFHKYKHVLMIRIRADQKQLRQQFSTLHKFLAQRISGVAS